MTPEERSRFALDAAEARIAAVEALCEEASAEAVDGGRTDVDTLWPVDILTALAGKRKP